MVLPYRKRKHLYSYEKWRHRRVFKKEIIIPISKWYKDQYSFLMGIVEFFRKE